MNVAFTINRLALVGLGATLSSLVRNCSNTKEVSLWFFCFGLHTGDKDAIAALLESELYQGTVTYVDFDAEVLFGHLPSLHGDWTAYGRLLIPTHVKADRCLYLDADIIVLLDVLALKDFPLDGHLLAAVYGCTIADALDKSFFITRLGWSQQRPYFNSGVVLFNLARWLERDIDARWNSLANEHGRYLVSHDQTLLNAVCDGDFARLPPSFNMAWLPIEDGPPEHRNVILHFVGSPKPWDFFGSFLHKGYRVWRLYSDETWAKSYGRVSAQKIVRSWKIRRSLIRSVLNKLRAF